MPTGYTADVCEGKLTFKQFVLQCSRAFGALITLRDEPFDTPVPDEIKPSMWHQDELVKAEAELKNLTAMDSEQQKAYGAELREKQLLHYAKYIQDARRAKHHLSKMLEEVQAWTPPSPNHYELKTFMLQQIEDTINHDGSTIYWDEQAAKAQAKSPLDFYNEALDKATWGVSYHTEENQKEIARAAERTKWIQDLRRSLEEK